MSYSGLSHDLRLARLDNERLRAEIARLKAEKTADWKACCEAALAASTEIGELRAKLAELEGRR